MKEEKKEYQTTVSGLFVVELVKGAYNVVNSAFNFIYSEKMGDEICEDIKYNYVTLCLEALEESKKNECST